MPRRFRFAFSVAGSTLRDAAALRARARAAESLGYAIALVPDHMQNQLAPVPAMMFVAEATARLRVGSFVFANDLRHPGVLARDLVALDLLSEGRLEIGLGAGWSPQDYALAGVPLDPPPMRIARLREAARLLKELLECPSVDFEGSHYRVSGAASWPLPVQRPRPPLLIGGGGREVLSLAAREADIVSFGPRTTSGQPIDWRSITADAFAERVEWIRRAAGDRFADLELNTYAALLPPRITDEPCAVAASFIDLARGRWPAFDLTVDQLLQSPMVLVGTVPQLVEKLQEVRERFGISYFAIQEGSLQEFAPVVERLAGS